MRFMKIDKKIFSVMVVTAIVVAFIAVVLDRQYLDSLVAKPAQETWQTYRHAANAWNFGAVYSIDYPKSGVIQEHVPAKPTKDSGLHSTYIYDRLPTEISEFAPTTPAIIVEVYGTSKASDALIKNLKEVGATVSATPAMVAGVPATVLVHMDTVEGGGKLKVTSAFFKKGSYYYRVAFLGILSDDEVVRALNSFTATEFAQ